MQSKRLCFQKNVFLLENHRLLMLKLKLYLRLSSLFAYLDFNAIEVVETVLRKEISSVDQYYTGETGFHFVDRRNKDVLFSDLSAFFTALELKNDAQSAERMWRTMCILKSILLELVYVKDIERLFPQHYGIY